MAFICNQCPRRCGVLRGDQNPGGASVKEDLVRGFCRMGELPVLARAALHFDEEPCVSGTRGSGTVFFSGCSLRCAYCQNAPISHGNFGAPAPDLRRIFEQLIHQGAHNINLVNPTHFLHAILEALREPLPVPVVYNTSGYEMTDSLKSLEGKVRVYLPDLKYIDRASAGRYSGAPDYFEHAAQALGEMLRQQPEVVLDDDGVIERGVIVRHLILPGRAEESMRILDWIAQNLPSAWVSLMAQYTPMGEARRFPEIDRRLTEQEYERVVEHLLALGLEDGYIQELSSADERYTPAFDLTGVETTIPLT